LRTKKILYFYEPSRSGGAEKYFRSLIKGIDKRRFQAVLYCRVPGLISLIKKERPDIVHFNFPVAFSCVAAVFAARLAGAKNLTATVHSTVLVPSRLPFAGQLKTFISKLVLSRIDRFICVSKKNKEEFCLNYGVPENKVFVVYNGIEAPDGLSALAGLKHDGQTVALPGRLVKGKGHEHFLSAMQTVIKEAPPVRGRVIGGGPLEETIKKAVKKKGLENNILMTGEVKNIYPLLEEADIIVVPSDFEAFPYVVLEAMALSRPVIASDAGGLSEMIENGVSGLLVKAGDERGLADAIIKLLKDKKLAGDLAAAGNRRVRAMFTFEKMISSTERIYDAYSD